MPAITRIPDIVDGHIIVFRHDESGFFSISNALSQFHELYPYTCIKKARDWMRDESIKALIQTIKKEYSLDKAIIGISKGAIQQRGIYVHPHLYYKFLNWVDPIYNVRCMECFDNGLIHDLLVRKPQLTDGWRMQLLINANRQVQMMEDECMYRFVVKHNAI